MSEKNWDFFSISNHTICTINRLYSAMNNDLSLSLWLSGRTSWHEGRAHKLMQLMTIWLNLGEWWMATVAMAGRTSLIIHRPDPTKLDRTRWTQHGTRFRIGMAILYRFLDDDGDYVALSFRDQWEYPRPVIAQNDGSGTARRQYDLVSITMKYCALLGGMHS